MASSDSKNVLSRCLQSHRRLVRSQQNPYTHQTRRLADEAEKEVLIIGNRMFLEASGAFQVSRDAEAYRKSFESVLSMLSQVHSPACANHKPQLVAAFLCFSSEHKIACMSQHTLKHAELLFEFAERLPSSELGTFLRRVKLEILMMTCCRGSPLFTKHNGGRCYSILMKYFQKEPNKLPLHKRNLEIGLGLSKMASIYIRSIKDPPKLEEVLVELSRSPAYPLLPATLKRHVDRHIETKLAVLPQSVNQQHCRSSRRSRNSKSSFRSSQNKQSFSFNNRTSSLGHSRNSQCGKRTSTLLNKISNGVVNKRLSCQPDMLRHIQFQKFYSNQNSVQCEIDQEAFSGEESEVAEEETPPNKSSQVRSYISGFISESIKSCEVINLDNFYQFLKLNGRTMLVAIREVRFRSVTSSLICVNFRISSVGVRTRCRILLAKDDPIVMRRHRHEDMRHGLADRIRTSLHLQRTVLGQTVKLTNSQSQKPTVVNPIDEELCWLRCSRRYNSYFMEYLRYHIEFERCKKSLYNTTMSELYEESLMKLSLSKREALEAFSHNLLLTEPEPDTEQCAAPKESGTDVTEPRQYHSDLLGCSTRFHSYNYEAFQILQCSSQFKRISSHAPLQSKLKEQVVEQCIQRLQEKYQVAVHFGERVKTNIDGTPCEVTLSDLSLRDTVRVQLQVVNLKRKTTKYLLVLTEDDISQLLALNLLQDRVDSSGIAPLLCSLCFRMGSTYSRLQPKGQPELEYVIDKWTVRTESGAYAVACLSYLKCFKCFVLLLYFPSTRITWRYSLLLTDIVTELSFLLDANSSFEQLSLFPDILREVREGLQIGEGVTMFGKELDGKVILDNKLVKRGKGRFLRLVELKDAVPPSPLRDFAKKYLQLREIGLDSLTQDRVLKIELQGILPSYYRQNISTLQNPIKPEPMDMNFYRFCLADLRRLARSYEPSQFTSQRLLYLFVNNRLHKVGYSDTQIKVCRLPNEELCTIDVEQATNKIPFLNQVIAKARGYSQRKRIVQSLNIAYPSLYLSR